MTQIKPTYVTFEQAKRLKELSLSAKSDKYWVRMTKDEYTEMSDVQLEDLDYSVGIGGNLIITKYQQWQVVEWLRVVHGIWIHIYYLTEEKCWGWDCYRYENENGLLNEPAISFKMNLKSPQEAYSSAFDHVLNNLI